jgi:tetratricopeptide (TPR) repeat protein
VAQTALVQGYQDIVALMLQSVALTHEKRWHEALACLDAAYAINPKLPLCQVNRATVLLELRRYEEAIHSLDAFIRYAPASAEILSLKQEILQRAFEDFEQALSKKPEDVDVLLHRGNLFRITEQWPQALADYALILQIQPEHVDARNNQGNIFVAQHRYDQAIQAYTLATTYDVRRADIWFNLANVMQFLGRFAEARSLYQRAIALNPNFAEAHMEIAHCWFYEGNYSAGWPFYEWRWHIAQLKHDYLATHQPLWLADKKLPAGLSQLQVATDYSLHGKTLLIWAEQGLGDTLQFVRFIAQLLTLPCQVTLRVPAALCRLMQSLDAPIQIISHDEALPKHDLHCPLMSLPFVLGMDTPPSATPYLFADKTQVLEWKSRLGAADKLRVGLAWAGRQYGLINKTRDIPLSVFQPLTELHIQLISLQKDIPVADIPTLQDLSQLQRFDSELDDFAQTAALIENLDIVISADTAIAHLASALGKPCWLMLRDSSEWRWQRDKHYSAWYPSIKIFRQTTPGEWSSVIAEIMQALPSLTS